MGSLVVLERIRRFSFNGLINGRFINVGLYYDVGYEENFFVLIK